ncbi:DUF952 domain-containing protein [Algihabitans albus]|uniref:DUF952 domain-containing protein n=1 Tax=Algihabitans albus TaxID=2164067 RepID=UPI000E5CDE3B|nr:DUF952 domain-containing protein [Algihabitans albus]
MSLIFHVCPREAWTAAETDGRYRGSADDERDGFIHFSIGDQVMDSVAKHRAGQDGLVILGVAADVLGQALKWEPSRGGQLFPHLYGTLPVEAVVFVRDLPLGADGRHLFPSLDP